MPSDADRQAAERAIVAAAIEYALARRAVKLDLWSKRAVNRTMAAVDHLQAIVEAYVARYKEVSSTKVEHKMRD